MGAGPPFLYSRARDAGSSLALISPRDGDRRFTSAITVTWRPRSAVTKSVGGVTVRARFSRSARIVRAVATRLLVSCMIRPSTPVGGVHLVENACTSATVRLMSIRALFGQCGRARYSREPGARHAAYQASARDSRFPHQLLGAERLRAELRRDRAAVQL